MEYHHVLIIQNHKSLNNCFNLPAVQGQSFQSISYSYLEVR